MVFTFPSAYTRRIVTHHRHAHCRKRGLEQCLEDLDVREDIDLSSHLAAVFLECVKAVEDGCELDDKWYWSTRPPY